MHTNDFTSIRKRLVALAESADGKSCGIDLLADVQPLLQRYHPLSLADLSKAKLMRRMETKYVIPLALLPEVLDRLQPHYSILEIDGNRIFNYHSLYFDTANLRFYRMHHNGLRPRFKVRHRRYLETDTAYMETKVKTNQNRTLKERIKAGGVHPDHQKIIRFSRQHLPATIGDLFPRLSVDFKRITLADETSVERLTLDTQICFRIPDGDPVLQLHPVVIAEYKTLRDARPDSAFSRLMRRCKMPPESFSKYCVGCSLLYPEQTKANRFKPIFMKLQSTYKEAQASP